MITASQRFTRRRRRTRYALRQRGGGRPRLSVFRSNRYIYAQVIDDTAGRTVAAASSLEPAVKTELTSSADKAAAERVGALLAERARSAGVGAVVFDRGGYMYHGRVRALAEGARAGGLEF